MLQKQFNDKNVNQEFKNKIKTVLNNALTKQQFDQITNDWEALQKTHPEGQCNYETIKKYWVLQDQIADSTLFIKSKKDFTLALEFLGYSELEIKDQLHQNQKEITQNSSPENPFEEYGIRIIKESDGANQFTIEPFLVFRYDTDVTVDVGLTLDQLDSMDLETIQ